MKLKLKLSVFLNYYFDLLQENRKFTIKYEYIVIRLRYKLIQFEYNIIMYLISNHRQANSLIFLFIYGQKNLPISQLHSEKNMFQPFLFQLITWYRHLIFPVTYLNADMSLLTLIYLTIVKLAIVSFAEAGAST
jgi:hypothetical protein